MPEDVQTGGLMKFRYDKDRKNELSEEKKREIREAYARADERKRREKKNKVIMWVVIALIVIAIVGFYFMR